MANIAQGAAECYISLKTMPSCYSSVLHECKLHFYILLVYNNDVYVNYAVYNNVMGTDGVIICDG